MRLDLKQDRPIDPAQFNDWVALQTQWTPLKFAGANFLTQELIKINASRVEFKCSRALKAFFLLFFSLGLILTCVFVVLRFFVGELWINMGIAFSLVWLCFTGGFFFWSVPPMVFDKQTGYCWRGKEYRGESLRGAKPEDFVMLQEIHALQLLSERCESSPRRGSSQIYYSYELNLVLNNGKRINVVDHGDEKRFREDARVLSEFLDRPIWDGITGKSTA